ncbi:unnamed protein product, partial [Polarella glacialis]
MFRASDIYGASAGARGPALNAAAKNPQVTRPIGAALLGGKAGGGSSSKGSPAWSNESWNANQSSNEDWSWGKGGSSWNTGKGDGYGAARVVPPPAGSS